MSIAGLAGLPHPQLVLPQPTLPAAANIDRDGDHDNNAPDVAPAASASAARPLNVVA